MSPGRRQAIIETSAGILLIGPIGTNFNEILIEICAFSFTKIHLKILSGKWQPFCLSLNLCLLIVPWEMWLYLYICNCESVIFVDLKARALDMLITVITMIHLNSTHLKSELHPPGDDELKQHIISIMFYLYVTNCEINRSNRRGI